MGKRKEKEPPVNPLFVQWLTERMNKAQASNSFGPSYLNLERTMKKAVESMSEYPVYLKNAKEALKVKGIGKSLQTYLETRQREYCKQNNMPYPESSPPPKRQRRNNGAAGTRSTGATNQPLINEYVQPKPKTYVPKLRSGGYGILIGLYQYTVVERVGTEMYKSTLMKYAQPHCDASYDIAEKGLYTAWKSMMTLIEKELVSKRLSKRPAFSLTEEGEELARGLYENAKKNEQLQDHNNVATFIHVEDDDDQRQKAKQQRNQFRTPARPVASSSRIVNQGFVPARRDMESGDVSNLRYVYLNADFEHVSRRDKAKVMIEDGSVYFLTAFVDPPGPDINYKPFTGKVSEPGFTFIWLSDECGEDICPTLIDTKALSEIVPSPNTPGAAPGDYLVELKIDNREIKSKKTDRDYVSKKASSCGIPNSVCQLEIGDFLWTAKKTQRVQRDFIGGLPEELYLDIIVERKRTDDLMASIKDRRFADQQGRLKATGSANIVYLIENHPEDNQRLFPTNPPDSQWHPMLQCATMQTLVHKGFHVELTKNMADSIEFFSFVTKYLESKIQNKVMKRRPPFGMDGRIMRAEKHKDTSKEMYCVSFDDLMNFSKNGHSMSIKEMFMKQMMAINGVTLAKALAVVKEFPTVQCLMDGYYSIKGADKVLERHEMLTNLVFKEGLSVACIKANLSRRIHCFFYSEYETENWAFEMQKTLGVPRTKAEAISDKYGDLANLWNAYQAIGSSKTEQMERLLEDIRCDDGNSVGLAISKKVFLRYYFSPERPTKKIAGLNPLIDGADPDPDNLNLG
eukprot:Nk52_evm24s252 gene=Nk52_evmTU24s252